MYRSSVLLLLILFTISVVRGDIIECNDDICYWGQQESPIDPAATKPTWVSHPTKSFQIAATELTVLQYKQCVAENEYVFNFN